MRMACTNVLYVVTERFVLNRVFFQMLRLCVEHHTNVTTSRITDQPFSPRMSNTGIPTDDDDGV